MKSKILYWLSQICCSKNTNDDVEIPSISKIDESVGCNEPVNEVSENQTLNINSASMSTLQVIDESKKLEYYHRSPTFGNPSFSDLCMQYIKKEESTGGTVSKRAKPKEKKIRKKSNKNEKKGSGSKS